MFNNLLRRQIGTRSPTVEYLCSKPDDVLISLVKGYAFLGGDFNGANRFFELPKNCDPIVNMSVCSFNLECFLCDLFRNESFLLTRCRYESPEIALNCGNMVRECVRHEPLAKIILNHQDFYKFFGYVELSTFDIASDAFATFKVRFCHLWLACLPGPSNLDFSHFMALLRHKFHSNIKSAEQ